MAVSSEVSQAPNHGTVALTATKGLVTPLEFDVLCSKDKTHSTHTGNRLFRERIDAMKEVYRVTKNKQGKMEITKNIVKYLKQRHATRFLKRDANGSWTEISDQAARDKVSHALRFATRRDNTNSTGNKRASSPSAAPQVPVAPAPEDASNNPTKPTTLRESSDASGATAESTVGSQAAGTGVSGPVFYGRTVPVEHIEPSKWLLALRQGP
ncbi:hypothetical protein ACA910_016188 [Epithemia clementina (nom. ined.)]